MASAKNKKNHVSNGAVLEQEALQAIREAGSDGELKRTLGLIRAGHGRSIVVVDANAKTSGQEALLLSFAAAAANNTAPALRGDDSAVQGVPGYVNVNGKPVHFRYYPPTEGSQRVVFVMANDNDRNGLHLDAVEAYQRAQKRIETLQEQALTDPLTGLPNRYALADGYENKCKVAQRQLHRQDAGKEKSGIGVTVLMIDIDHFKKFNDTYGHDNGDAVLRQVAKRMRDASRPTDMVVRWGGEELVCLLQGSDEAGAMAAAERIRTAVAETPVTLTDGREAIVTISVGVASHAAESGQFPELDTLLKVADVGLYAAKAAGRNCVCRGEPSPETPQAKPSANGQPKLNS